MRARTGGAGRSLDESFVVLPGSASALRQAGAGSGQLRVSAHGIPLQALDDCFAQLARTFELAFGETKARAARGLLSAAAQHLYRMLRAAVLWAPRHRVRSGPGGHVRRLCSAPALRQACALRALLHYANHAGRTRRLAWVMVKGTCPLAAHYDGAIEPAGTRAWAQVDQPLCMECAGRVREETEAACAEAEAECAAYEAALGRLAAEDARPLPPEARARRCRIRVGCGRVPPREGWVPGRGLNWLPCGAALGRGANLSSGRALLTARRRARRSLRRSAQRRWRRQRLPRQGRSLRKLPWRRRWQRCSPLQLVWAPLAAESVWP